MAALSHGSLAVVQPIVVTTIVFAVFVRSALDRTLPDRQEVLWAICTWVGLALFVGSVHSPDRHHVADDGRRCCSSSGPPLRWWWRRRRTVDRPTPSRLPARPRRGSLYGMTAGLIKTATSYARIGVGPAVHHWSLWLVAPVGLSAFALSQRAFQEARLSVSVPVLNIVDVLVAVAFGCVVFGDRLFSFPLQLVAELLGATMMAIGVGDLSARGSACTRSRWPPVRSIDPDSAEVSRPAAARGIVRIRCQSGTDATAERVQL